MKKQFPDATSGTAVAMALYRKEQEAKTKRTTALRELRLAHEAEYGPREKQKVARAPKPPFQRFANQKKSGGDT